MALLLGIAAVFSTLLGGLFALKWQDKLHLILGFSAGAVVGVAFFDLLPEALQLGTNAYGAHTVTALIGVGFLLYMLLNRVVLLHPHAPEDHTASGALTRLDADVLADCSTQHRLCVTDTRGCRGWRRQGWNEGDGQTWTGAGHSDDEPFPLDL